SPVADAGILQRGAPVLSGLAACCFQRFGNTRRRRVTILVVAHGTMRSLNHVRWRGEIKNIWVANIQIQNFMTLSLNFIAGADEVADRITQIVEALSWSDFAGLGHRHKKIVLAELFFSRRFQIEDLRLQIN